MHLYMYWIERCYKHNSFNNNYLNNLFFFTLLYYLLTKIFIYLFVMLTLSCINEYIYFINIYINKHVE